MSDVKIGDLLYQGLSDEERTILIAPSNNYLRMHNHCPVPRNLINKINKKIIVAAKGNFYRIEQILDTAYSEQINDHLTYMVPFKNIAKGEVNEI